MGCCFSRATTQNQNPVNKNARRNQQPDLKSSPPKVNVTHEESPPPLEEESVKEVLSETPISKPHQVPILMEETNTQMPLVENENPVEKFEMKVPIEEVSVSVSEVASQLSEVCTVMSESFSTATTVTVTEKREDEAISKQCSREGTATHNKWNQSPSRKRPHAADGNVNGGRERRVKSPARRPEPSPEKKLKGSSRFVRGRESSATGNRKLNAGSAGLRRDSGEGSGRRSRSPSCVRTAGGTSKVGIIGGRKQTPSPANDLEMAKKNESEEVEEENEIVSQGETIENPHVSMECFIFL